MIKKLLNYAAHRLLMFSGLFFLLAFALWLFCRSVLHCEPEALSIHIIASCCAASFVVDLLFFVGRLTAKPQATQIGNKLFITKGSSIVATVVLKDDHPLSDDEIAVIIEDVARFAAGER